MAGRLRIVFLLMAAAGAVAVARAESASPPLVCAGVTEAVGGAVRVVDARALELGDGRVLRLAGIEPFDLLSAGGDQAAAELQGRLAELVKDAAVRIELLSQEPDRYGRLAALVWAGGELVQDVAAREGLALAFASGAALPCFEKILAAEAEARRARRGFWRKVRVPAAFPEALAARIGGFAIFEGRVLSVGNRRARSYLNFGRRWTEDVTVEIAEDDRALFGGEEGLAALAGRRVRVRGFLEEKGGPMLVLRSPMQIEALDPAKETSGHAP